MASHMEKLAQRGIVTGEEVDIRELKRVQDEELADVILYWEKDLAVAADYEHDLESFRHIPEENRPFIRINTFLKFFSETYSAFPKSIDELLADIPIRVMVTAIRKYTPKTANEPRMLIIGLMPFEEDMEV